jgi:hypothetical protein
VRLALCRPGKTAADTGAASASGEIYGDPTAGATIAVIEERLPSFIIAKGLIRACHKHFARDCRDRISRSKSGWVDQPGSHSNHANDFETIR